MNYICPGIGLAALIIALLLWWLRRNRCQHDLSLRNIAAATNAHEVRVSAYTPATQILNASAPSNWTQTTNYPASILWRPIGGGPIPSGNPLPGPFSIWVQNNTQPDKRVLIEWLSRDGREVVCKQIVRVGCGENPDLVPEDEAIVDTGTSKSCRCLSVETDSDEDSNQFAEPDLSVDVGMPVLTGYLQVEVPYTIEVEPPTLQFTRQWDVTVLDELGEEQLITVPISDNLTGVATFTLPDAGDYNFYLTVTDPATCVSATDRDDEEYTDTDFTSFRMTAGTTHFLDETIDPCDPRRYKFTNDSNPLGLNPEWTVKDQNLLPIQTGSGNIFFYDFPSMNVAYQVCLTIYDSNAFSSEHCETVTPTVQPSEPSFDIADYDSCVFDHFVVHFVNTSHADPCPVTWDWDFGDSTPHSTDQHPTHTYVAAGTYTVTLTMTVTVANSPVVTSTSQQIIIEHWVPDINVITDCLDGHVIYETTAPAGWHRLHRERTWTFENDAHLHEIHRHKKKVRVCYDTPGLKIVRLYAINDNHGECEARKEVNITTIERCCPHDKIRQDQGFTYNNKEYQLRMTLRYHGGPLAVIFAKSKLMLKKNNIWRRKRAYSIQVEFTGDVFTKEGDCFCSQGHAVHGLKAHSNRARVAKRVLPSLAAIRVKQNGITCNYSLQVDGNDPGQTFALSLWVNDCGCS